MSILQKNLQLLVSLCATIFGILIIYFVAAVSAPNNFSTKEITAEKIGMVVTVTGEISKRTQSSSGHLFLTLDNKLQVPIFSQLRDKIDENTLSSLKVGNKISVTGVVDEYRNNLQVIPRATNDIKILGG